MDQKYLTENTDNLQFILNIVNSPSISAKKKRYNSRSFSGVLQLIILFTFFCTQLSFGQNATAIISTTGTGTWTVPAGVTGSITVEAWGAGGSGGGASGNQITGSGGTGGTYVRSTFSAVVAGTVYNIYVAPQTAVGASGNNGNSGAASWFNTNLILNANGGLGGKSSNGAAVSAVTTGSFGTTIIEGGSSVTAAPVYYGTAGGNGGNGGGAGGANSNRPGSNSSIAGNPGSAPGGGGGGGATGGGNCGCQTTGGSGARGEIRITYTCPANTIANAGSNQTLTACSTTTTLAGNTPTYGTGNWTVVSGTATITTPSSPTSGVTGLALGSSATLRWTITNGACGTTSSDMTITAVIGAGCQAYCTVTARNVSISDGITRVIFNTINNTTSAAAGNEYNNYTATSTTTVTQGIPYSLSAYVNTGGNFTQYQRAWFDWNGDGDFEDAGEAYNLGFVASNSNGISSLCPLTISIPLTSATGSIRMRISSKFNIYANPCETDYDGEIEDYSIMINPAPACVVPATQPTSLTLTPAGTSISGSFSASAGNPAPDNYLIVLNTTGTAPIPQNGTNYSIGESIGAGNTIIDTDANTVFIAGGLNINTTYYIFIYSFNRLCTGGPLYRATSPLSRNTTTTATLPPICTPATTSSRAGLYITQINFIGTLNDITKNSTYPASGVYGYEDFTGLPSKAIQVQGEAINLVAESDGTSYQRGTWKAWVDWNKDGDFVDSGEEIYNIYGFVGKNVTFGFRVPSGAVPGNYRLRIRVNNNTSGGAEGYGIDFDPCQTFGSHTYGEAEDYLFTVISNCDANILTIKNGEVCGSGPVDLNVTGTAGTTQYRWYASEIGDTPIISTPTGTWKTPILGITTSYWVTAFNGSCESIVRKEVIAKVSPIPTLAFTLSNPSVCGENTVLSIAARGNSEIVYLINETFDGSGLGVFSNVNNDSNATSIDNVTMWQNRTSIYIPQTNVWFPAISSGFGQNKFVLALSDSNPRPTNNIENALVLTTAVNSVTFSDLTLKLKLYYSRYYIDNINNTSEYVAVELSTDDGVTYPITLQNFTADTGIGSRFATFSYNLGAYLNQPKLKIRIRHHSDASGTGWLPDGIAIDDIQLFGARPLTTPLSWSGASLPDVFTEQACINPYTPGSPASIVYVRPTLTQLELGSYTFTTSTTLSNGCTVSQDITIANNTKLWKGSTDNDWNKDSNWLPAQVPTASSCVIIPNGKTSEIINNPNALAKNITIKPTGKLELSATKNLTVTDFVDVNRDGIFNIRDNASLVQITDADNNTGTVNIERITKPISQLDYTYWNSPVTFASNFTLGSLSSGSPLMFSWTPTISNGPGNWQNETTASIMDPRKGYIVRAPNTFSSSTKTPYTATFKGTPNNGTVMAPIAKGTLVGTPSTETVDGTAENDEWNLIGNPYPSGIDAAAFLNFADNIPIIDGTVYIWTHNSQPSTIPPDPFYGDYVLNYTDNDYAVFNSTGGTAIASTGGTFSGFIASGQSFFVKAANTMTPGATGLFATFNNGMRVIGKNSDFFKLVKNNKEEAIPKTVTDREKHRIWINLTNNSGAFSQTLVGYVAGATQELDRSFDAESLGGNDVSFYSIIPQTQLTIQGRALPFEVHDQVSLGYNSEISGELSIRIDHIDGLFDTQNIYLEDKELSVIHNLKEKPYVFNTEIGDFNDRFVLRYADKTLGTDNFNLSKSDGVIVIVNQNVTVQSSNQLIKNIVVYDLLGRKIDGYKKVNALKYTLSHLNKTTAGLIVKITLDNDTVVSKKIIY